MYSMVHLLQSRLPFYSTHILDYTYCCVQVEEIMVGQCVYSHTCHPHMHTLNATHYIIQSIRSRRRHLVQKQARIRDLKHHKSSSSLDCYPLRHTSNQPRGRVVSMMNPRNRLTTHDHYQSRRKRKKQRRKKRTTEILTTVHFYRAKDLYRKIRKSVGCVK